MKRHHWDNLAGEHRIGDIGQLTLYCLFMALWISDMLLNYSNFLNEYIPAVIRLPIGIIILIISGYMAGTGLWIIFGKKSQPQGVVRKGVFRFVRHPIYLSEILLYLGLLFLNISLAAALVWIMAILFLHYISRYEEKLLLVRFGKEYEQYTRDVPMWIPRIWRK
jgi:protein-S-isoprenylcysteine O-methyltransferase Ste14